MNLDDEMMNSDELYMRRVLELAEQGKDQVAPNPMVGCIIVKDDSIIGEGWHQEYGKAHAERNAIDSVKDPSQIPGSTVYVNLEPCSHFGKTPPCSDILIRNKVKRVVISNIDPNPLVDGGGIKKLQEAGIEVNVGILKEESEALNRAFFQYIRPKTSPESVVS